MGRTAANLALRAGTRRNAANGGGRLSGHENVQRSAAPVSVGTVMQAGSMHTRQEKRGGKTFTTATFSETIFEPRNALDFSGKDYHILGSPLNPTLLAGDLLKYEGVQFQKFAFRKGTKFRWVPSVPTTMPGQVCIACVDDVTQDNPSDFASLRRIEGAKVGSIFEPIEIEMTDPGTKTWYMKVGEQVQERFYAQGSIRIAFQGVPTAGTPSVAVGDKMGQVIMQYNCEFSQPDPSISQPYAVTVVGTATAGNPLQFEVSAGAGFQWDSTARRLTYNGPRKRFFVTSQNYSDADESVDFTATWTNITVNLVHNVVGYSSGFSNGNMAQGVFTLDAVPGGTIVLPTPSGTGNLRWTLSICKDGPGN